MQDDGEEPDYPEAVCAYLIGYLFEVGPVMQGDMGPSAITQEELRAWQSNTGIALQPWESRVLRRLSSEWIEQAKLAEDPECAPPYKSEAIERIEIRRVAADMRASIRELADL